MTPCSPHSVKDKLVKKILIIENCSSYGPCKSTSLGTIFGMDRQIKSFIIHLREKRFKQKIIIMSCQQMFVCMLFLQNVKKMIWFIYLLLLFYHNIYFIIVCILFYFTQPEMAPALLPDARLVPNIQYVNKIEGKT